MSARVAGGPIRKLLIANRGEIAVRVITACREIGIQPVAVYSDADRGSLHVQRAGEAIRIGAAPAADSYLNQDALVAAAKGCGADAIHPGYGFLAENAEFAERCCSEGLTFVGPSAAAIRLLADKAAAKRLAVAAGVPTAPGYDGEEQSDARLAREAQRLGYPLMIKAALGGGGKGMHVVRQRQQLRTALAQARREAVAAFGNGRLMLERLIERARHIEVQIVGDAQGAIAAVGERECSIQRRHQKVIEESPSPAVDETLRRRLIESALAIGRAAGYSNVGTVEFLVDQDGSAYFLEMNTRLQVEHAVTEAVHGVDLVQLQLSIASGDRLPHRLGNLPKRGHAIECRIYAEDPRAGFLPSTGRVLDFRSPDGPGTRNDVGTYTGDEIGPYYDPLLAKLTVHAPDRASAIARMRDALTRYTVLGVRTNVAFLQAVMHHPDFEMGTFDVEFLDREQALIPADSLPAEILFAATAAKLLHLEPSRPSASLWSHVGPWRTSGQGLSIRWEHDGQTFTVGAHRITGGAWALHTGESAFQGFLECVGDHSVILRRPEGVSETQVASNGREVWVGRQGESWRLLRPAPPSLGNLRLSADHGSSRSLAAPMPGRIVRVDVKAGDRVRPHQVLVILEAMKMEHAIEASSAGAVRQVHCRPGDLVSAGAALVDLDETA